jgi:hypothetical protein
MIRSSDYKQQILLILLSINILITLSYVCAHDGSGETSLGTYMTIVPDSTDAPAGDEFQIPCELNLPPEKVEFRFRPQNSTPDERDRLINVHKMVMKKLFSNKKKKAIHFKCKSKNTTFL